ncbi:MAG: hypothetical protein GXO80_07310 [Chlorobi bacterium]|nr:hypothetical protein [Chlorobiota bacterium]
MQLLTLKNLKNYNLFSDKNNKLIYNALFISKSEIKLNLKTEIPDISLIQLFSHNNKQLFLTGIISLPEENAVLLKGNFKLNENYFVKINNEKAQVIFNPEIGGILDTVFYHKTESFGILFSENKIRFKLWSPPAVKIELLLYDKNKNPITAENSFFLTSAKPGIWETAIDKKYENFFYQYKIIAYGKTYIGLDPYAKSMAVFNPFEDDYTGKAAIINLKSDKANPSDFNNTYRNSDFTKNETDIIVYELNVRDFTIQPGTVNENIAGTFKGFIEKIPYLKELGITHVQLMPVNKAFTQNETNRAYTGKDTEESNYNWGYDPMNYFTLEGRFSTNPNNLYTRICEFKKMVQSLHNAGIGIILDVVFNHTFTADTFENIAPGCYYRIKNDFTISGHTGAGASLESRRKQVRKFIIDALKFWITEYHIDGFRFDLMSFIDKETLRQIRKEVGKVYNPDNPNELILHGEAWNFTDLKKGAFTKTDFESFNIGIFNDTFRDALAENGHTHGFIHGNTGKTSRLASAIISGIKTYDSNCLPFKKDVFFNPYNLFAEQPGDCLNFMSVHDGLTLWDKINLTVKNPDKKERLRMMKFAYAILLTSQGKIILHAGDEILRTKPLADFDKKKHRALTSEFIDEEEGATYFHENSYQSPDFTNMFRWDRLTNEYAEFAGELLDYIKGLIKMRRKFPEFRLNTAKDINHYIELIDENCDKTKINSFKSFKLHKLTLKFINGNPNETLYLTGEIHKTDANPVSNPYILKFNGEGIAEITFNKKEINNFDLQKWDKTQNLNFKLVTMPGQWNFSQNFYSEFGNNSISPVKINENFEITTDLARKDFKNIEYDKNCDKNYIAFKIRNKIITIHNTSSDTLQLKLKELSNPEKWSIIVDNKKTDIENIKNSEVKIATEQISVPRKSTAVIIKK